MKKCFLILFLVVGLVVVTSAQPCVWSITRLSQAKKLQTQPKNLIRTADKVLSKPIQSVVDKQKAAPSGDIHDYISCGPYWCPDPQHPDGPYIRRDGEVNKAVLTPDKINLSAMSKGVVELSLAYYFTNDEKYASKAVENLRVWFLNPATRMNPNLNYGQTIFGRLGGKGRGAGLIETYTFVEMLDGVELLKKSKALTTADIYGLEHWFSSFLDWMLTSEVGQQEYNAKNNHGTAFDVQATRIALFVGKQELARKFIREFPERRLFAQIEPDGRQPAELVRTKALHYSMFNLTHILDMCQIAGTLQVDLLKQRSSDGRSVKGAFNYLASFVDKPQSAFPYQQIADWDATVKKLQVQLFRYDRLSEEVSFMNYYQSIVGSDEISYSSQLN